VTAEGSLMNSKFWTVPGRWIQNVQRLVPEHE